MADANLITITGSLRFEVGVAFSKYVKLFSMAKWMTFSEKLWLLIKENENYIDLSLSTKTDFLVELSPSKSIKVAKFMNQWYVSFCESFEKDGKTLTKFITLNPTEWRLLTGRFKAVDERLSQDVVYCNYNDNWYLLKDNAIKFDQSSEIRSRLVPRMCVDSFNQLLNAYLVTVEIDKIRQENCDGCKHREPGQKAHMGDGCLGDWDLSVDLHVSNAEKTIKPLAAVITLNKKMGWDMSIKRYVDAEKVRDAVIDHQELDVCEKCTELPGIYWSLFQFLKL